MTNLKTFAIVLTAVLSLAIVDINCSAQTAGAYQQMSAAERANFVSKASKEIVRRLSDSEYQFTASFETEIQTALNEYAQRLGINSSATTSSQAIFERGQINAPTIMSAFKARGVSPLIGLYIPWIESEYVNETVSPGGGVGMFQFLPQTGQHLGLATKDLLNVATSADAAARYLAKSMESFDGDNMKELLAILSYNRGTNNVQTDLARFSADKNSCSICELTAQGGKSESAQYIPRFIAAAIFGENPRTFGLTSPALSSFGTGN